MGDWQLWGALFAAPFAGILAGAGGVFVFNRIPAAWLCDYGEKPSPALSDGKIPRLKSFPWIAVFSLFFTVVWLRAVFLLGYAAPLLLAVVWLLLLIAVSDWKYMIIPDQFVILLALCALGFWPLQGGILPSLLGGLCGGGVMLFIGLLGRLLFGQESLGFGDVKLFVAVGLAAGPFGTMAVLVVSSLLSSLVFLAGMALRKVKRTDLLPLGPYITAAAAAWLLLRPPGF